MTTKLFGAIIQFFQYQTGWTLLFALSHVLFWTSTYPIMREYGYSDRKSPTGAYVSGQYGSGIVPVTLTFVIIFSIIWIVKVANALRFALAKESWVFQDEGHHETPQGLASRYIVIHRDRCAMIIDPLRTTYIEERHVIFSFFITWLWHITNDTSVNKRATRTTNYNSHDNMNHVNVAAWKDNGIK